MREVWCFTGKEHKEYEEHEDTAGLEDKRGMALICGQRWGGEGLECFG